MPFCCQEESRNAKAVDLLPYLVALCAIPLVANMFWVDSRTRKAAPRDGGQVIDTQVVPANVTIEGVGPTRLS